MTEIVASALNHARQTVWSTIWPLHDDGEKRFHLLLPFVTLHLGYHKKNFWFCVFNLSAVTLALDWIPQAPLPQSEILRLFLSFTFSMCSIFKWHDNLLHSLNLKTSWSTEIAHSSASTFHLSLSSSCLFQKCPLHVAIFQFSHLLNWDTVWVNAKACELIFLPLSPSLNTYANQIANHHVEN